MRAIARPLRVSASFGWIVKAASNAVIASS